MWGTIRTVDPEGAVSEQIHQRMTEIAQGVAAAIAALLMWSSATTAPAWWWTRLLPRMP